MGTMKKLGKKIKRCLRKARLKFWRSFYGNSGFVIVMIIQTTVMIMIIHHHYKNEDIYANFLYSIFVFTVIAMTVRKEYEKEKMFKKCKAVNRRLHLWFIKKHDDFMIKMIDNNIKSS